MNKLAIEGGVKLDGEITLQGAKNAVLPILAATILTGSECIIHNCPRLRDVEQTGVILEQLGCGVRREGNTVIVNASDITDCRINERLMREMRS